MNYGVFGKSFARSVLILSAACVSLFHHTADASNHDGADISIESATLINAETHEPVPQFDPIPQNAVIDLGQLGIRKISIVANTSPKKIGSVHFDLKGEHRQTENYLPYCLKGDYRGGTRYHAWRPDNRNYTLEMTPYSKKRKRGKQGETYTLNFTITNSQSKDQKVQSLTLINADTDKPIPGYDPLAETVTLDLSTLPTRNLSIHANTLPEKVGSVGFWINENIAPKVENITPYAIAGDNPRGDYNPWTPALGKHTISAAPYTKKRLRGKRGEGVTVKLLVIDSGNACEVEAGLDTWVTGGVPLDLKAEVVSKGQAVEYRWKQTGGDQARIHHDETLEPTVELPVVEPGRFAQIEFLLEGLNADGQSICSDSITLGVFPDRDIAWDKVRFVHASAGMSSIENRFTNNISTEMPSFQGRRIVNLEQGILQIEIPEDAEEVLTEKAYFYWSGRGENPFSASDLEKSGRDVYLNGIPVETRIIRHEIISNWHETAYTAPIPEGLQSEFVPGASLTLTVTGMDFSKNNNGIGLIVPYIQEDAKEIQLTLQSMGDYVHTGHNRYSRVAVFETDPRSSSKWRYFHTLFFIGNGETLSLNSTRGSRLWWMRGTGKPPKHGVSLETIEIDHPQAFASLTEMLPSDFEAPAAGREPMWDTLSSVGENALLERIAIKDYKITWIGFVMESPSRSEHPLGYHGESFNWTAMALMPGYKQATFNQYPKAVLTADATEGDAPLTVQFDCSESMDADGEIVLYTWDLGDGTVTAQSECEILEHNYDEPGEFIVTLTVTDDDGAEDTAELTIVVLGDGDVLEAPELEAPPEALVGQDFDLDWTVVEGAALYQVEAATDEAFTQLVGGDWPSGTTSTQNFEDTGVRYFRVRAWTAAPEEDGVSSDWSNVETVDVIDDTFTLDAPVLSGPESVVPEEPIALSWAAIENAAQYQTEYAADAEFETLLGGTYTADLADYPTMNEEGTYYFRVRAWAGDPEDPTSSDWSNVVVVEVTSDSDGLVAPTLSAPDEVESGDPIELSWTAVDGAALYQTEYATDSGFSNLIGGAIVDGLNDYPTMNDVGEYYFRVRGWTAAPDVDGLAGEWSNVVEVSVIEVSTGLTAPVLSGPAEAVETNASFDLTWNAIDGAALYQVELATDADFNNLVGGDWPSGILSTQSFSEAGTRYARVRAWTAAPEEGGESSPWSNAVSIEIVNPAPVLDAPSLSAPDEVESGDPIELSWTAVDGAALYQTEYATDSDFSTLIGGAIVDGLNDYPTMEELDEYYFRVRGWTAAPDDDGLAGEWSNKVSVTVTEAVSLAAPSLTATDAIEVGDPITMEWTAVDGATIYQTEYATDSGFSNLIGGAFIDGFADFPTFNTTGNYFVRVRAWTATPENDGESGPWSNVESVSVTEVNILPAPVLQGPSESPEQGEAFGMNWNSIDGAILYQLQKSTSSNFETNLEEFFPSGTQENLLGQPAGTYYFRVRAWGDEPSNGGPGGEWSNLVTVVVTEPVVLDVPVLSAPASIEEGNPIVISWTDANPEVAIYQIERAGDAGFGSIAETYWPMESPLNVASLPVGTHYFRIRSWNPLPEDGGDSSEWSGTAAVEVTEFVPDLTPPTLSASSSVAVGDPIEMSWTAVADAAVYQTEYATDSNFNNLAGGAFINGLSDFPTFANPGTVYLRVRAWSDTPENGGVSGGWSNVVSAEITLELNAPTLSATDTVDTGDPVTMEWNAVDNANIYQTEYATDNGFSNLVGGAFINGFSDFPTFNDVGTYYLRVRAWSNPPENGGVSGPWSNTESVEVTQSIVLAAPNLNGPASAPYVNQAFDVTWNAIVNAAIYQVEIATDPGFSNLAGGDWPAGTASTQVFADAGTRYFRVRAWSDTPENGGISGAWSNTVTVEVLEPIVLGAPALSGPGSSVAVGEGFVMEWSPIADASIYQLQQSTASDFSVDIQEYYPGGTQESVSLPAAGVYFFRVRAWSDLPENGGFAGDWSNTVSVTAEAPLIAPVLSGPDQNPVAGAAYAMTWNPIDGAVIYQLVRRESDGGEIIDAFYPSGTGETLGGLAAGTYYHQVRAWSALPENGGSPGEWSNTVSVTVEAVVVPNAPVLEPITFNPISNNQPYTLQWNDTPDTVIYELQYAWEDAFVTVQQTFWPSISQETVTGLGGFFRVRAWSDFPENGGAPSAWSNSIQVLIQLTDVISSTLSGPASVASGSVVNLTWTDQETDIVIYELQRSSTSDFASIESSYWPSGLGESVADLPNGTHYFRVRAWTDLPENDGFVSAWSNTHTVDVN